MSNFVTVPRVNALLPPPISDICNAMNVDALTIEWLAGDGSDRCYYRLRLKDKPETFVLMLVSGSDAEALKNGSYEWITMGYLLREHHIHVPHDIVVMPEHGALIIEDYGNLMLETQITDACAKQDFFTTQNLFYECFDIIVKMLKIPFNQDAVWCQRSFDQQRFAWELNFFLDYYCSLSKRLHLDADQLQAFEKDAKELSTYLANFSKYFVHRDYHTRNIMLRNGVLAVIDFQDARLGPAAYDLVSLIFDNYIPLNQEQRLALLNMGISHIDKNCGKEISNQIIEHWKAMLLQRQLKAIGSYGFLSAKKQRGNYLKYVPIALDSLTEDLIYDERWPFISGSLPLMLKNNLVNYDDL